jgi:tRNA U34 5-carboxymethylaminomethyl modifying GTPase MnmE/TrmE
MGVQLCCKNNCYSNNNINSVKVEPDEYNTNNYNSKTNFEKKEVQNSNSNPTINTTGMDLLNNSSNKTFEPDNSEKKSPNVAKVSNIKKKLKSKTTKRRSAYLNRTFINIMVIGDKNTGKTSFLKLLKYNKYSDNYETTKEDEEIFDKNLIINQNNINMNILVCNNINKKETINLNKDYYLFFYDITNINSLEFIKKVFFDNFVNKLQKINDKLSNIIFVGNKIDLKQDNIIYDDMENFCNKNNVSHFEISTKKNIGINELSNLIIDNFNVFSSYVNN